ncbi:MAG: STAS/SEC14 domain-containing protein [Burkholderiales bacterium]|nr:STAS/SEC14 domain-containing protein [Burkholderiales bacterium]
MIAISRKDKLVSVAVMGEFTLDDYREFEREMLAVLPEAGKVDVLMDLRDMLGYTLDVAWEEIRFSRSHADDFGKIAIVTDEQWMIWTAWLSRLFIHADLRVFDEDAQALEWLTGQAVETMQTVESSYSTLIAASQLITHLSDPNWIIFDCRHDLADFDAGESSYGESHIPGARFAHLDRNLAGVKNGRNGRHPLPHPKDMAAWLGSQGVANDSQVVAYDASGGIFAARLWWLLRWLGHDKVAVLDGGWQAWAMAGYPATTEPPELTPREFYASAASGAVDVNFVHSHLQQASMRLLDARAADRFAGENETLDPIGGHIPGALNRSYKNNLDQQGRFKPADVLRREFQEMLGSGSPGQIVHQCGSGVTACHNLLAMEIAGLSGSRLYPGSWSEWCSDTRRPIATG